MPAGFNPMWNEKFQFNIHVAELALLRFVVEDYDSTSQNDLIGQYCLPLSSVQNGKRVQHSTTYQLGYMKHLLKCVVCKGYMYNIQNIVTSL